MNIYRRIKKTFLSEYVETVRSTASFHDYVVWKFNNLNTRIKNGAHLVVENNQLAVLVNGERFGDVFYPGIHELSFENLPVMSVLEGLKPDHNIPYKFDVYFVSTSEITQNRWKMSEPAIFITETKELIPLLLHGTFDFRTAKDPASFVLHIAENASNISREYAIEKMKTFVLSKVMEACQENQNNTAFFENEFEALINLITENIKIEARECGVEITCLRIDRTPLHETIFGVPINGNDLLKKEQIFGVTQSSGQSTSVI